MAKILIVDDESNIRMMLRLALEHVGHTVGLAADGDEGLEKFGNGSGWNLVLLDHRMPGIEGIDVLREIRARKPDARVVMITAFGTVDLASEALRLGATDFLRKPFTVELLREAVDAALRADDRRSAAETRPLSFERAGINGFRLLSVPGIERAESGGLAKSYNVQRANGAGRTCRVEIAPGFVERLGTDRPEFSQNASLWDALCSEALANYLWQHGAPPPDGKLVVDDLTRGLRRWLETLLPSAA